MALCLRPLFNTFFISFESKEIKRLCYIILIIFVYSIGLRGQSLHLGFPISEQYSFPIETIEALTIDNKNNIFFYSNKQLIKFKGSFDVIMSNKKDITSLYYSDENLYFGADKSYGNIIIDSIPNYSTKIKFDQCDGKITHIVSSNYGNFILAENKVFHFNNNTAKKYSFPGIVDYLGNINNSIILHDDTNGLSLFVDGRFRIVNNSHFLSSMKIKTIKSIGSGEYIVATKFHGLFRFDGESFSPFGMQNLQNKTILDIEVINSENVPIEIIIITEENEILALNISGLLVSEKMYSHTLFALEKDNKDNLYVLHNKGVTVFFYNLPFQVINRTKDELHGPICIFDEKLYWGTNNGLYYSSILETNNLKDKRIRVKDTEGKVGELNVVNNSLLMTHDDGLYDILPKIGARFIPDEHFYTFQELNENYLLAFSNRENYLLKRIKNKWVVTKKYAHLPVRPKSIFFDKHNQLWIVDREYTLIQYKFDSKKLSLEKYSDKKHIDKTSVFGMDSMAVLIQGKKAYHYNQDDEKFIISEDLSAIFGEDLDIEQLKNDNYGNYWYIQNGKVGVFRAIKKGDKILYKKLKIDFPYSNARNIYPYGKNNVFINNGKEIIKLDLEKYNKVYLFPPIIDRVYSENKKGNVNNLYIKSSSNSLVNKIKTSPTNNLYIVLSNELSPDVIYEFSLTENNDSPDWKHSSIGAKINIPNIGEGEYMLNIRRQTYFGTSETISIPLEIKISFWKTKIKYYFAFFIILIMMFVSYKFGVKRGKQFTSSL